MDSILYTIHIMVDWGAAVKSASNVVASCTVSCSVVLERVNNIFSIVDQFGELEYDANKLLC